MRNLKLISFAVLIAAGLAASTSTFDSSIDDKTYFFAKHIEQAEKQKNETKIQNADDLYKFQFSATEKYSAKGQKEEQTPIHSYISTLLAPSFKLHQSYPNPFNSRTFIKFEIMKEALVTIDIFNARGTTITHLMSSTLSPGLYIAPWDATDESGQAVNSGVYYVRLSSDDSFDIKRMVLLR